MADAAAVAESAEERLRLNLVELMEFRRMKQSELAERLGRSQSWVSKRLAGKDGGGNRFQMSDLDALATIFGLSPWELLQPAYGKWDRRSGDERRSGHERRRRALSPFNQREHQNRDHETEDVA
jgi:transcriptional regulator with XRE-family HTH domain